VALPFLPVVESDWGAGYCVHLDVTNVKDEPTTTWVATVDTNQSTIFTSWNAEFSGNAGPRNGAASAAGPSRQRGHRPRHHGRNGWLLCKPAT
jgi:cellulase/cellobiase CelA1